MSEVRMSESEVARNFENVLEKILHGAEVLVEREDRAVALITAPHKMGRSIEECIARAREYERRLSSAPTPDPEFAKDVQIAVESHRETLDSSVWG